MDSTATRLTTVPMMFRLGQRDYDLSARTHIMGILNVTPDSFSDGGNYLDPSAAVDHALQMEAEGADIIDIGGESTRPKGGAYGEGADAVPVDEELRRTIPVIEAITARTSLPVSIDTMKSEVAERAVGAGAVMVNDVSAFSADPRMAETVGRLGVAAVLMHMKGTPKTMQADPQYDDLFGEIAASLRTSIRRAEDAGVSMIMIDPGLGFGKTASHNFSLLRHLGRFAALGRPLLVGPSRKSFLGTVLDLPVSERLEGTLAACTAAILNGAHVIRVHDVRAAGRAALVADAVRRGDG